MAKSRAQRKAEQRRRQREGRTEAGAAAEFDAESRAQHDTQVPESADVLEAELAEHGADLDGLRGSATEAPAPSRADVGAPADAEPAPEAEPADKIGRRARRAADRERRRKAKESEQRRAPRQPQVERQRGGVSGFIASCWAELKRVQWPDRDTLIQASAITVIFIAIMAAYLGVLDAAFNWVVQRIL